MGSEDKEVAKVLQALSSSGQSAPYKKERPDDASRGEEIPQEYLKSPPKKELLRPSFDKEKKPIAAPKCSTTDQLIKTPSNKGYKNQESRKTSLSQPTLTHNRAPRKQQRKRENPVRLPPSVKMPPNVGCSSTGICKNSACKAYLTSDDMFCKRCSCCICHSYDPNKDPSLWLVCTSESNKQDSCGLSCHIECALRRQKVGVVDLGHFMQLDGSYCCASCGKVSGILGCWKKQLMIAKDARRMDVLCYRISLSYKLLDGTSRFEELHKIVGDAKAKLELEVGPLKEASAMLARGIVSRLSVAGEVQKLCSLAIEKADACLNTVSDATHHREDSLPAACRFQFEEVTSSSLVIVLKELLSDNIKGYKLWCCKSKEESHSTEPIYVLPRTQSRILISNLKPFTEYSFRIIAYSEAGNLGCSEAKCFTKNAEVIYKNFDSTVPVDRSYENSGAEGSYSGKIVPKFTEPIDSSSFKVRDLGNILPLAWEQGHGNVNVFPSADVEEGRGKNSVIKPQIINEDQHLFVSPELDLNVVAVPDLNVEPTGPVENVELTGPVEYSRNEEIVCTAGKIAGFEDGMASHGTEKNGIVRSNGSGGPIKKATVVESRTELSRKQAPSTNEEACCDSTMINGSQLQLSGEPGHLDANFEYCVENIRLLECQGHITPDFRLKFLSWFGLRASAQERKVVSTFITTLNDDPSSLAGQLIDSFFFIITKKQRNGL